MKSSTPEQMRTTGMRVFEKSCAACHRLNNTGLAVGPDVSDSRDQTFEKLLVAVLDPNRSIDANYFRYLVRTEDGRILEGLLRDVNSQTVTIANQTGSAVVDRSQIEELKSSGMSLMPEGFEAQIGPDEMNALLWYIKNWRYALENIPANAELPVPK
jgi:putative heme-binding domain-containing protein